MTSDLPLRIKEPFGRIWWGDEERLAVEVEHPPSASHPEWVARLKDDANANDGTQVKLLERAVALIQPTLQRVLTAG